jgi:hypothetical protein
MPTKPLSFAHWQIFSKLLKGASSPINCAIKMPGPLSVVIGLVVFV